MAKVPSTLTPAYGRDYRTAKAVKADWEANKDFIIADFLHLDDGRPANRESFLDAGIKVGTKVTIRFAGRTKVCVVRV